MNEIFDNPIYKRDLEECVEKMKVLLSFDPLGAYHVIRNYVTEAVNMPEFKDRIKCGTATNCSFCCHDRIDMGKVEAEYIKSVVKAKNIVPNKDRIQKQNSNTTVKWMDKACPLLLDENEKGQRLCSIYEDRPLVCRTHNSTMDPKECNRENDPNKPINEGRSGALDACYYTSVKLGHNGVASKPNLVSMHEILRDVI